jgi:hypothetical protein
VTALNVITVGIAGTAFCAAAHVRARAMTRGRLAATDKLVERLEALMDGEASGDRADREERFEATAEQLT